MPDHKFEKVKGDHLADLKPNVLGRHTALGGCFSVLGPIELCYDFKGQCVEVSLKIVVIVATVKVCLGECQTLEANLPCGKASIEVCLKQDGEQMCLTYAGKACYKPSCPFGDWECANASGSIICV